MSRLRLGGSALATCLLVLAGFSIAARAQVPPPSFPPPQPLPPPTAVVTPVPDSNPGAMPGAMPTAMPPPPAPWNGAMMADPGGGPPGRLVALPLISERRIRELASDVALQLRITLGYRAATDAERSALPKTPEPLSIAETLVRDVPDGTRFVVRLGYVIPPRRLPQLWVQSFTVRAGQTGANADGDAVALDPAIKEILAERSKIFSRLRIADLATATIPLSYVDTEAALFALRAMGYSVVTDSESMQKDDSYRGGDVNVMEGARAAEGPPMPPEVQVPIGQMLTSLPPDEQKRFLPRYPAIKNLPTTISLDRLPLIVKMPATDPTKTGLVGADLNPAQRDQLGLTVIPSAAAPLADTVAGGGSELLVIYHPAYPEELVKLRRVIDDTVDKPAKQVYVEALVLEVSQDALKDLGVQWSIKKGDQTLTLGSLISVVPGGNTLSFGRDSTTAITPSQVLARVNALVQADKAEILSRPSVITLDNRQATIRVGTDIPVATSKDAGGDISGSSRVAFSFQYIPTGILLNVRPRISEDLQEISMLIDATVSATVPGEDLQVLDPTTKIALASAPTISTRRVQTYARIRDNQPLIIGGLLSRNQVKSTDRVPLLGDIPYLGALFGHTNITDDRREVIIVLTPSVVTENIRETKSQYPKDDSRFDLVDTQLFKEHYRIKAEDLVDSSDFRFNARFRAFRDAVNKLVERDPSYATRPPFAKFVGDRIPGEFYFVTGMMYRMLDRLDQGDGIRIENLKLFEALGEHDQRPISVSQLLARYGDGSDPDSFFEKNPGKALALTFTMTRNAMTAVDPFTEPFPEIRIVDCPDRDTWRRLLWEMSQPGPLGLPRYTILLNDRSDLRRLQLAFATNNTVLNNGGIPGMLFDRWLVGRMIHLQEVSPTWERILNAQIAQYFFIGTHYYMAFAQEFQRSLGQIEQAFKVPEVQQKLSGITLPP